MSQHLLGLIPARCGSKRVPDKNGRPFAGTTLLQWSVHQAMAAKSLDAVGLSTDSLDYVELARKAGLEENYRRPAALGADTTGSADVILDYLDWLAGRGARMPTHVVLLQPTSPFRTAATIDNAIAAWRQSGRESLVSVTPTAPDHRFLVRDDGQGRLMRLDSALAPVYALEGSLYITPVALLRAQGRFWDENSLPFVVSHPRPFDIDTAEDFTAAQCLLQYGTRRS